MNADDRIATLRQRVLDRKDSDAVEYHMRADVITARSLRASEDVDSLTLRRGLVTRDRLADIRFIIDDLELLAGRLDYKAESTDCANLFGKLFSHSPWAKWALRVGFRAGNGVGH